MLAAMARRKTASCGPRSMLTFLRNDRGVIRPGAGAPIAMVTRATSCSGVVHPVYRMDIPTRLNGTREPFCRIDFRRGSVARRAVDLFAENVGLPGVPGQLLDHVH